MRASKILLTTPLMVTIFVALFRGTEHFGVGWSVHAEHHLVHQIILFIGLSLVGMILLYKALALKEKWVWWSLLVIGVAIYGGFWLGHPLVGFGESSIVPNVAQGTLSALYAMGLVTSWLYTTKEGSREEVGA